jgi:hypothetical protein
MIIWYRNKDQDIFNPLGKGYKFNAIGLSFGEWFLGFVWRTK